MNGKRMIALLLALCLCCALGGATAERLRVQGLNPRTFSETVMGEVDAKWYTEYVAAHPEIDLKLNPKYPFKTTKLMMNALEKGKLNTDVFTLWSHVHNTERFPQRPGVSINAYWDAEHCDNEHVYTQWLVGLLVRHYARQCEARGETADFDAPLFLNLLNRCKTVGDALYGHDGLQNPYYLFCEMIGSATNLAHCIPMRMTNDDPVRLAVEMICLCVSPKGDRQPQAEALIASYMNTLQAQDGTQSATEEEYDMPRARVELFASLDHPLVSGDGGYILDEAELAVYRELAQSFYFPMPGAFDSRAGGTNDIRLRFSRGVISAEQYIKELKRFVK